MPSACSPSDRALSSSGTTCSGSAPNFSDRSTWLPALPTLARHSTRQPGACLAILYSSGSLSKVTRSTPAPGGKRQGLGPLDGVGEDQPSRIDALVEDVAHLAFAGHVEAAAQLVEGADDVGVRVGLDRVVQPHARQQPAEVLEIPGSASAGR